MLKLHHITSTGILAGSLVAGAIAPAKALSFPFTTSYSGNPPAGDVFLDSVTLSNGRTVSDFSLINSATILSNDLFTGGQTGGASADLGDAATVGLSQQAVDDAGVVTALGNRYLSSIIDTEDTGSFTIDVAFDTPVRDLLFWERGGNSKLDVQALNAVGSPIGTPVSLSSDRWESASFSLDTGEVDSPQSVSSIGLAVGDLGIAEPIDRIRLISTADYNGADFKVVGATVSEPSAIVGLAVAGGLLGFVRRRR